MSTIDAAPLDFNDARFGARAVVGRLKEVLGASSDADLANQLRTAKANISKWKARNSVPYAEAVYVSITKGVSLDFLLSGNGSASSSRLPSNLDPEFIRAALQILVRAGLLAVPKGRKSDEALAAAAASISAQYERAEKAMYELVTRRGLSGSDARKAAIVAIEMLEAELSALQSK
jgi:hypothetical protein